MRPPCATVFGLDVAWSARVWPAAGVRGTAGDARVLTWLLCRNVMRRAARAR
jgi:hypothetical protein